MNKLILHHYPQSRSTRVLWLLYELELDFELIEYDFLDAVKNKLLTQYDGLGRFPVLENDSQVMTESLAILQYLSQQNQDKIYAPSEQDENQFSYLKWIQFSETLAAMPSNLFINRTSIPEEEQSELFIKLERSRLKRCLHYLNDNLENKLYLVGDTFTAADIAVGYSVFFSCFFTELDDFPHLKKWYESLISRESFKKAFVPAASA